jgi:hypothetical protein
LKQVDANGAVLISEVITISPTIGTEETTITIYPNPSNGDEITIQCTKKNEPPIIEVWDIVGKLLFAREMVGSSEVIKSNELKLVKGIYFIRIRNSNEVQKLIVN